MPLFLTGRKSLALVISPASDNAKTGLMVCNSFWSDKNSGLECPICRNGLSGVGFIDGARGCQDESTVAYPSGMGRGYFPCRALPVFSSALPLVSSASLPIFLILSVSDVLSNGFDSRGLSRPMLTPSAKPMQRPMTKVGRVILRFFMVSIMP